MMKTAPFVIFTAPRCGSTALYRALNLISGIHVVNQPMFDDIERSAAAVSVRVSEILEKNSGFKHAFDPVGYPFQNCDWATIEAMERQNALWTELNTTILNYPGLRIVFLRRKDDFQRIVSDMIARNTRMWGKQALTVTANEALQYKDDVASIPLPELDEELVRWYLERFPVILEGLRNSVKANPVLDVWYEDFFGRQAGLQERIAMFRTLVEFLEIPAPEDVFESSELALLLRPEAKLNDPATVERIPNYHELHKRFGGSGDPKSDPQSEPPVCVSPNGWRLRVAGENMASLDIPESQSDAARVSIASAVTANNYDIQVNVPNLRLALNREYRLRFRARADQPRHVAVGVAQNHIPWANLGFYEDLDLGTEWREFQREFIATQTTAGARIHFDVGASPISVEIGSVLLDAQGRSESPDSQVPALDLGVLRRCTPFDSNWGLDRGMPIDRYYVEQFVSRHAQDIRGRVIEIEDDMYTRTFGGARVSKRDVLHVNSSNPRSTIVADLTNAAHIPSVTYDCAIVTQTLQFIYDVQAAVATLHRILKPGGVLLATFPGITHTSREEWADSWFWSFTTASAKRLFGSIFGEGKVEVQSFGNVLTATSFLHGLAKEDLTAEEVDYRDPDYEVIVAVRAVKSAAAS
jgi:hypothetical protein